MFENAEFQKKCICLFDVDGTLTAPRQVISPEMQDFLELLKKKVTVGIVGGSDLVKILEQLGGNSALEKYDYIFSENGLVAHKHGKLIFEESIVNKIGEEKTEEFKKFSLDYMSKLNLPFRSSQFVEIRSGLINIAPPGRACTQQQRNDFEEYDKEHNIRKSFIEALKKEFGSLNLTYSIGGQISFDVFPEGWDKRFCLTQITSDGFEKIYFFGDKTFKGGNDHEIAYDPRTVGFTVTSPNDTILQVKKLLSI